MSSDRSLSLVAVLRLGRDVPEELVNDFEFVRELGWTSTCWKRQLFCRAKGIQILTNLIENPFWKCVVLHYGLWAYLEPA